ncbi:hypothetical protein ACP4OV_024233 [Aristida adscensionis]
MTMPDWASLPPELIDHVAGGLLVTNDLDCYMDFRAVCRSWRAATADPKASPAAGDPRFRPRLWAMLDEGVHQSAARLFVNLATGRFVRKYVPLLRRGGGGSRHLLVAVAAGGWLVVAERRPTNAARLLNPLTGALIRFAAPVPTAERVLAAHVVTTSSSPAAAPTLVLRCCGKPGPIYCADPGSGSFLRYIDTPCFSHASITRATPMAMMFDFDMVPPMPIFDDISIDGRGPYRCFLVEPEEEMMVFVRLLQCGIEVFKIDIGKKNVIEPVRDIGSRALFVGDRRCVFVEADKFPAVEANCIYYVEELENTSCICIYNLKDGSVVRAGGAIKYQKPDLCGASPPFTIVQLLCC